MAVLFDKRQAAAALGISTVSVDRLRKLGKLPFRRFGGLIKFTQEDIETFIRNAAVSGCEAQTGARA
jgi:excisionase family DNA binding protein